MKRIVSLWLPSFATDRLCRVPNFSGWRSRPFATVATLQGQRRIAAANAAAQAVGIAPSQPLTDARALEPGLHVVDADPFADQRALAALAEWCTRYTPWTAAEELAVGGIFLDITGCAHLFGGEARLLADLVARLEQHGFAARAAVADTPGAAWAVARFTPGRTPAASHDTLSVPPDGQRQALATLPLAALRLPPEAVEGLGRLGLCRIGALYPLPRAPLARRFGPLLCSRLDQALGLLDEPISPRQPAVPWRLQLAFAEPIATQEDIAAGLARLLAALCARLAEKSKGARQLVLMLYRSDGTVARAEIGTSKPMREINHLEKLFAEKLEKTDPGLGLDLMALAAPVIEPLEAAQTNLVENDKDEAHLGLGALVDRLANRLGFDQVRRLVPVASYLPERAQRTVRLRLAPENPSARAESTAVRPPQTQPRPLRLFVRPQPVDAIAPVPDDPPPLLFRWRAQLYRVRRADGPERIAGEWWHTSAPVSAKPRDYYRVEDESGRRFWLYREGLYHPDRTPRWFLHGLFA